MIEQYKLKARDYREELEVIKYMKKYDNKTTRDASGDKRNEKRIDQMQNISDMSERYRRDDDAIRGVREKFEECF